MNKRQRLIQLINLLAPAMQLPSQTDDTGIGSAMTGLPNPSPAPQTLADVLKTPEGQS
jgi:hypothetical protein